jgi:glycogen debranching enzyme
MAEVFDASIMGARRYCAPKHALCSRFNEAFWDEELGFYAYALDGDKEGADRCVQRRTLPVVRHRAPSAPRKSLND